MIEWSKTNDAIGTVNRGNPAESGLCTLCRADCKGRCETFLSSLKGRKILYPRDFGTVTAGSANTTHLGVNYNALRIQGYLYGVRGLPKGLKSTADDCIFPNVSIESEFGSKVVTKTRMPIMTGALGSTFIAAKYWDSFATGAALVGRLGHEECRARASLHERLQKALLLRRRGDAPEQEHVAFIGRRDIERERSERRQPGRA